MQKVMNTDSFDIAILEKDSGASAIINNFKLCIIKKKH